MKLLIAGYGLALTVALAVGLSGAGLLAPILIFWLGGAVVTLAIAASPALRPRFSTDGANLQADMAAPEMWERDAAVDAFEAEIATGRRRPRREEPAPASERRRAASR
ncbi:MAG: hypothetical protein AAGE18_02360 [Pseudomonadota bacterium]